MSDEHLFFDEKTETLQLCMGCVICKPEIFEQYSYDNFKRDYPALEAYLRLLQQEIKNLEEKLKNQEEKIKILDRVIEQNNSLEDECI